MKAAEAIETRWSKRPSRKDLLRGDPAIAAVKCAGLLLQCLRDLDKMQALLQQEASVEVFTTYKLSYAMMLFASAQNEMDLPKKMPLEVWSFLLYGYHTSRFGVFSFSDYKKNVQKMKQGGTLLIETAYSIGNFCGMEFRPGFDNDPTNYWYPTINGLVLMLESLGMMDVSLVYADGIRCTVKCVKA